MIFNVEFIKILSLFKNCLITIVNNLRKKKKQIFFLEYTV